MSAGVRERLAARERETVHSRKLSGLHLRRDTLSSVLDEKERQVPPTPIPTTPGGDGRGRFGFAKPVIELPSHRHGRSDSALSIPEQKLEPSHSPQPDTNDNQPEAPTDTVGEEKTAEDHEFHGAIHRVDETESMITFRKLARPFVTGTGRPHVSGEDKDDFPFTIRPVPSAHPVVIDSNDIGSSGDAIVDVKAMYEEVLAGQSYALATRGGDASDPGSGLFSPAPPVVWRANLLRFTRIITRLLKSNQELPAGSLTTSVSHAQARSTLKYPLHAGDPVIHHRVRREFGYGEDQDDDVIVRVKPLICTPNEVVLGGDVVGGLDIVMSTIRFDDHPLFCKEDWLAAGLQSLHEAYLRRLRHHTLCDFNGRLDALLGNSTTTAPDFESEAPDVLHARAMDVLSTLSSQQSEGEYVTELVGAMYAKWTAIRQARAEGGTHTSIRLSLVKLSRNGGQPSAEHDGEEASAPDPGLDLYSPGDHHIRRAGRMFELIRRANRVDTPAMLLNGLDFIDGLDDKLRSGQRHGLWIDGEEYMVRLSYDVPVTTDTGCSRAEQDRRRDIRKTTVFAQILVNGQVVATSPKAKLQWPNFTAHVPVSISVDVARRPERVQVQLWECGWVFNSLISSVDVPIPGSTVDESVASETVEPIDDWFTFSAVTPLPLSAVSFLPPAVSHVDGKTAPTRERFACGVVRMGIAWSWGYLPARPVAMSPGPVLRLISGYHKLASNPMSTASTPINPAAASAILSTGTIDPNDPKNRSLLGVLQNKGVSLRRGDVFRSEPMATDLSLLPPEMTGLEQFEGGRRHQLLKLRSEHPEAFKEPIPLREEDVRKSQHLSELLYLFKQGKDRVDEDDHLMRPEDLYLTEAANAIAKSRVLRQRVIAFFERLEKSTSKGQTLLQLSSKYATIVHEDPPPMKSASDFAGFFKMFLPVSWLVSVQGVPLSEVLAPRRALLPRRLPGLASMKKVLPNGSILEEKVEIAVQVVRARNVPYRRITEGTFGKSHGVVVESAAQSGQAPGSPGAPNRRQQPITTTASSITFVQMSFQGQTARTSAHTGSAPQWNELLTLPFKAPSGDYSPAALDAITDTVTVSIFDEVTVSYIQDDRDKHTAVSQTEDRYLGSFCVPFTTLYHNGHIEGEFRLDAPLSSLAYISKKDATGGGALVPGSPLSGHQGRDPEASVTQALDVVDSNRDAHVFVSLTLVPRLQLSDFDSIASNAVVRPRAPGVDNSVMDHAKSWEIKYNKKDRPIKAFALNSKGHHVLLYRFLAPVELPPNVAIVLSGESGAPASDESKPPELSAHHRRLTSYMSTASAFKFGSDAGSVVMEDETKPVRIRDPTYPRMISAAQVIRYVAALPRISDWVGGSVGKDVWLTCAETLEIGSGNCEERAVLMCNYLLALEDRASGGVGASGSAAPPSIRDSGVGDANWRSYLVMGLAIPDGEVTWVLRRHRHEDVAVLIDPMTGLMYSGTQDDSCPLRKVYMVVGRENMWANVHAGNVMTPWHLSFSWEVEDTRKWAPLYSNIHSRPLALPDTQTPVVYTQPSQQFVTALEREIVEVLRSEIRSWRPRFPTQFLYELIGGLHPLLQRLEAMKAAGTSQTLRPFDIGSEFLACKELARLSNDFYVHGFPINLTFTDLDSLVQTVKKTNIHDIENPQTKFGLSALVYPYPNEVFSVWIFLVSLVPKHLRRR